MARSTTTARSVAAICTSASSPLARFDRSVWEEHMGDRPRNRQGGPGTRLARGSQPPQAIVDAGGEWLLGAVRARFPKLASALGDNTFDTMLAEYLLHEPPARRSVRESGARLADYLARQPTYPVWYAELARLDRAHVDVLHAPA